MKLAHDNFQTTGDPIFGLGKITIHNFEKWGFTLLGFTALGSRNPQSDF